MPCTMYIPVQSANATNQIAAGRQQRAKKENRIPNLEGVHLALSLVPKSYNLLVVLLAFQLLPV
jgi:hypothetical protein